MRKCDGYAYILNALYWRGKGKTMFSPILEVTSIQDGGALAEKVYTSFCIDALHTRQITGAISDLLSSYQMPSQ